jgi:hypothetical protein
LSKAKNALTSEDKRFLMNFYVVELGMGIEPTKIGYLARVGLPICGDAFSLKSFFGASFPFFLFSISNLVASFFC